MSLELLYYGCIQKKISPTNMRVQLYNVTQSRQYVASLQRIGEDRMATYTTGIITFNRKYCNVFHITEDQKYHICPALLTNIAKL